MAGMAWHGVHQVAKHRTLLSLCFFFSCLNFFTVTARPKESCPAGDVVLWFLELRSSAEEAQACHSHAGLQGRQEGPSERRFPGVAPLLVNVGFNAILDELPGRLERIQVAGKLLTDMLCSLTYMLSSL